MNKKTQKILAGVCLVVLILILVVLSINISDKNKPKKYIVGYVVNGTVDESGWNGEQYHAIKKVCEANNIKLIIKERVTENSGDCRVAVEDLISEEADLIFLTSYNYAVECEAIIKANPDVVFYSYSSDMEIENVTSYFAGFYQARYLSGIIAGMKTKTNKIGYVAAMENSEVNRGINAFTLGVKSVNEDAEVCVVHSDSWCDEEKEKAAATKLIEEVGVDVITCHQNKPYVVEVAEAKGIYSIAYHEKPESASDKCLAIVACNWEKMYEVLIQRFLKGNANESCHIRVGMEEDAVECKEFSAEVSEDIVTAFDAAKHEILSGKEVFSGEIYDTEGKKRCGENENISEHTWVMYMDWYVEGVKLYD